MMLSLLFAFSPVPDAIWIGSITIMLAQSALSVLLLVLITGLTTACTQADPASDATSAQPTQRAQSDVAIAATAPEAEPTEDALPTLSLEPSPTRANADTGLWLTWDYLKDYYPDPTGPHIFLRATDHSGLREFGLQIVCWPTEPANLQDRRLGVMLAETFTDPDTIAAIRLGYESGYHEVEVAVDGESLGPHGWLLTAEEGPVDAYHYSEVLTASVELSGELVDVLSSGSTDELVATVRILGVEDPRAFDVKGAGEALVPVLEACRE